MIKLEDKLYSSTEVADILGVSLRSVYRYIEEDKLHAEVKTATGRHRFTKQDILNFLYPEGFDEEEEEESRPVGKAKKIEEKKEEEKVEVEVEEIEEEKQSEEETKSEESAKEEESVDWLSKFREAAKKFQEEEAPASKPPESTSGITGLGQAPIEEKEEEKPAEGPRYYTSALGGLKDIAQNVDKSARNAGVPYAFTLNAGLSLYSPIKPFSLLHVYVRESDLPFYEKSLQLSSTDESDAQLCLVVTSNNNVFKASEELHGLFVVDKEQLAKDIESSGDGSLKEEAEGVLK